VNSLQTAVSNVRAPGHARNGRPLAMAAEDDQAEWARQEQQVGSLLLRSVFILFGLVYAALRCHAAVRRCMANATGCTIWIGQEESIGSTTRFLNSSA
jgi:hypothetical protein